MQLSNVLQEISQRLVAAIQDAMTGKVIITINFSQGSIGDIKASREERIKQVKQK